MTEDIQFGVDYYPEHWDESMWEDDAREMENMGLDVVRLAEFSWAKLEPSEGDFNFGWLDRVIEIMKRHSIKCVLGTPSAAPPAWIIRKNPEIQPIDRTGRVRHFGGRHHDCQSNPVYREHIKRYVTAFAKHFGDNDNVIGFQIDNELGNSHGDLCMCDSCKLRFQGWLKDKYKTVDELNRRWGTAFWSQNYSSFDEIGTPLLTVTGENPSQMLDWNRFCSDLIVEFHSFQAEIIRKYAKGKFITHNMMGFADKVSYFDLAKDLDFSSQDQYPGGHFWLNQNEDRTREMGAHLDFIRATKNKPFWMMEQQSSITGWEIFGRSPKPDQIGAWAMQSIAHGADAVCFFRWRSCLFGTEQYWHGIMPHSNVKGRAYREIYDFIKRNKPLLKEINGAMPKNKVAILFSYDQLYAMRIQPHNPQMSYISHLLTYYRALSELGVGIDFVKEGEDISAYSLVVAPLTYILDKPLNEVLRSYVENGGKLVLTMRSGVKDNDNICIPAPLPANFCDVAGLTVEEYDCLRDCVTSVQFDGKSYEAQMWCDILSPSTAKTLATYSEDYYKGTPAITVNGYGKGECYYVATQMSEPLAKAFLGKVAKENGLLSFPQIENVEFCERIKGDKRYIFAINFGGEEATVPDFAGGNKILKPFGYEVFTLKK